VRNRMQWRTEDGQDPIQPQPDEPVSVNSLFVTLGPMQIRTFEVTLA